jgi:spore coat protein U-like protein
MAMGAGSALAGTGTDTGNLQVTTSVLQDSQISDDRLSFGQYVSEQETNLDAVYVDVVANCTTGTVFQIYSTTATRQLVSGGNHLNFQLYSDSGRSVVLPVANTTGAIEGAGTGGNQTIAIYGRMASGQTAAAGNYALATNLTIFY